jgi:hypothetical protein
VGGWVGGGWCVVVLFVHDHVISHVSSQAKVVRVGDGETHAALQPLTRMHPDFVLGTCFSVAVVLALTMIQPRCCVSCTKSHKAGLLCGIFFSAARVQVANHTP